MRCTRTEDKLVEYLDGRAKPAERRAIEEHLSACADCRIRAEEFRALFGVLDDLQQVSPSTSFDASLRARIAAEPRRRPFWNWLPLAQASPSPSLRWLLCPCGSPPCPRCEARTVWRKRPRAATQVTADSEFGMIRDLPVLENYDVLSNFDALSELPTPPASVTGNEGKESR